MRTFVPVTGPHGNWSIVLDDATPREFSYLRSAVSDNWIDSPFYKEKQAVSPFLQGQDVKSGWIYIEFWCDDYEAIKKYVEFLNSNTDYYIYEKMDQQNLEDRYERYVATDE